MSLLAIDSDIKMRTASLCKLISIMKHVSNLHDSGNYQRTSYCILQIMLFWVALSLYISTGIYICAENTNLISWVFYLKIAFTNPFIWIACNSILFSCVIYIA
jgi:hypothetical protein